MLINLDVRTLTLACATMLACVGRPLGTGDLGDTESSGESDTSSSSSESTSTDTTDADSSSASDDSSGFIPPVDVPPDLSCDTLEQDCPDGEKCVPYASDGGNVWNDYKCVPVTGEGGVGDPCTWGGIVEATDDCDANSMCWDVMDVDGELLGTCIPFCTTMGDERPSCPAGYQCVYSSSLVLCIELCDPLLQDCGEGLGCFYAGWSFSCVFTTEDIPEGEPCGFINDCAPGNFCVEAANLPSCAGAACCAGFCDLDLGPSECAIPSTECVSFFEVGMAPDGFEDVGVCVLPG